MEFSLKRTNHQTKSISVRFDSNRYQTYDTQLSLKKKKGRR